VKTFRNNHVASSPDYNEKHYVPLYTAIRIVQELRIVHDDNTITQIIYFTVFYAVIKGAGHSDAST
jgi:hypothetical protein